MEQEKAVAIYSRKSRFTGKGESIENQIELCRQYIQAQMDGKTAVQIYEDEGFSGGTLDRPQFQAMMGDARAGGLSAVVVYRLDRISRDIGDFAKLIGELNDLGISFVSIKERFETDNPMGRAMMYIASVFSQLERETIAERIRDNMRELAKTGRWLGGVTPTGYASEKVARVTVDGKTRSACKLTLLPEEGALVRTIFQTFEKLNSLSQTDAYLLEQGYRTKTGRPTRFAIKNILTNPVYMIADREAYRYLSAREADLFSTEADFDGEHGLMVYNRTLQTGGKTHQIRPISEWIVSVGQHPGLIPGVQWVRVQAMLEKNRDKGYRKPRSHVALLSGLLYCGACGDRMRPKTTDRRNAQGEPVYAYLCQRKERSRSRCCAMKNLNGNPLDQAVLDALKTLPENRDEFLRRLETGMHSLSGDGADSRKRLEEAERELAEKEREIQALVSALPRAAGEAAETYILRQIDGLHVQCQALRTREENLRRALGGPGPSGAEEENLREALSSFGNLLARMTVEQKRTALRACVDRVLWDGETVHVYLFGGEAPPAVPLGEDSK